MLVRGLAALAGALLVLWWPSPPPPWLPAVAGALALPGLVRGWLAPACLVGMAGLAASAVLEHRQAMPAGDERVLAEVRIASLPQLSRGVLQFDGDAVLVRRPDQPRLTVRVSWRSPPVPLPRAGERWQLALGLRAVRGVDNPGAVDERRILFRDHVHARADVVAGPLNRRLEAARSPLLVLRERIAMRILEQVPDPAAAALLAALAVGYTGAVSDGQWRIYNATGITHLIAISGMHVTLFAAVAMALLRRLWGWWPWLALRVRRESFAAVGGCICAAGYALLAGWSVPTQRTLMMLLAGLAWRGLARASSTCSALGAALVLVLLLDPFAVLAAGFWLSFGAVGVILWREGARLAPPLGVRAALRLQLAITLALAPATFATFGSLSLAGLWVNPFAIPLFSLLLVPLVLCASALLAPGLDVLARAPLWLADGLATASGAWLSWAAATPGALWQQAPPTWWYPFAVLAVLLVVLPLGTLRVLALGALVSATCTPQPPPRGAVHVLALSAGASPLVLVVTRHHTLLYGTADRYGTRGSRVRHLVLPAASEWGLGRLDLVIAGRMDTDVAASLGVLRAALPVARMSAAVRPGDELPPAVEDCAGLGTWRWDDVEFEAWADPGGRGCRLQVRSGAASLELAPDGIPAAASHAVRYELAADSPLRVIPLGSKTGVWRAP